MNALVTLTYQNREILIIDDASTDRTPQIVEQEYIGKYSLVKLMKQPINRGVGAARNIGIKFAKGEILIILNADTLLPKDFIQSILPYYEKGADYVLVSNPVANGEYLFPRYIDAQYHYHYDNADWMNWTEGFSCRKDAALAVGGFPEIPGAAGEDAVFGRNLEEKGYKKVIDRSIIVPHIGPETLVDFWKQRVGRGKGSPRVAFYVEKKSLRSISCGLTKWTIVYLIETIFQIRRLFYAWKLTRNSPKGKKDFFPFLFAANIEAGAVLLGGWKSLFEILKKFRLYKLSTD